MRSDLRTRLRRADAALLATGCVIAGLLWGLNRLRTRGGVKNSLHYHVPTSRLTPVRGLCSDYGATPVPKSVTVKKAEPLGPEGAKYRGVENVPAEVGLKTNWISRELPGANSEPSK